MKIRPSIRIYFLIAMLLAGVGSITVLTVTSVNYFFSGLDVAMSGFLRSQAMGLELGDNNAPWRINELTVAGSWQDLPQVIQDNFTAEALIPNKLTKKLDGIPVFGPPKFGYFVMKVETSEAVRYVSLVLTHIENDNNKEMPPFFYIIFTGVGAIVVFAAALVILQKKVSTPVERLRAWAKGLDKEQLTQPTPNFHYSELNSLAVLIQSSLNSVQDSLAREQRFLGYASHELRTPIAVTRTNSELLRKMISKGVDTEKQLAVLNRIERAGYTMTDLTETLLWLNRQEDKSLPTQPIQMGELSRQVESELHYLLQGKSVEVNISTDDTQLSLPVGLCRIVITNLIRNAFQHLQNGEVDITVTANRLSILSRRFDNDVEQDQLGFGLGLALTKRLIDHYGWRYHVSSGDGYWQSTVLFNGLDQTDNGHDAGSVSDKKI